MDPFLVRLLIGALVIFIIEKVLALLTISEPAKQIINIILIIGVVLYIVTGFYLPR